MNNQTLKKYGLIILLAIFIIGTLMIIRPWNNKELQRPGTEEMSWNESTWDSDKWQ